MSKLYAVGDIHGSLTHLSALAKKVPFAPEDRIVFIGDYIDRGPDSRGTVEFLLKFREEFPGSVFLRGNHEAMLQDFLEGALVYGLETYLMNGGLNTLISYGLRLEDGVSRESFPAEHLEFLFGSQLMFQEGGFLFVHAGIRPGLPLNRQSPDDLLWIRDEFFAQTHSLGLTVVFGHTPMRQIFLNLPYAVGIDTGAVYGGKLSCVELAKGSIQKTYQV